MKAKCKTIRICSREWTLRADKKMAGGANFKTFAKNGAGRMVLGTKGQCRRAVIELLTHEVLEGILTHDNRRWKESRENEKILFCFNHDYLDGLAEKVVDAFVSCGLIDPNKKVI